MNSCFGHIILRPNFGLRVHFRLEGSNQTMVNSNRSTININAKKTITVFVVKIKMLLKETKYEDNDYVKNKMPLRKPSLKIVTSEI